MKRDASIPFLVLPWFLYRRLNARINGPVKDFKLYDGLKSRMAQTLTVVRMLIVFVRLALVSVDVQTMVGTFAIFYFFFVIGAMIFTFAYFNYFDDDLAASVGAEYRKKLGEWMVRAHGDSNPLGFGTGILTESASFPHLSQLRMLHDFGIRARTIPRV